MDGQRNELARARIAIGKIADASLNDDCIALRLGGSEVILNDVGPDEWERHCREFQGIRQVIATLHYFFRLIERNLDSGLASIRLVLPSGQRTVTVIFLLA